MEEKLVKRLEGLVNRLAGRMETMKEDPKLGHHEGEALELANAISILINTIMLLKKQK